MKKIVIFHTAIFVIDNYYYVNRFSLTMFNVCNFMLIIQILVHSHTKEMERGVSKQMIKCITMFFML